MAHNPLPLIQSTMNEVKFAGFLSHNVVAHTFWSGSKASKSNLNFAAGYKRKVICKGILPRLHAAGAPDNNGSAPGTTELLRSTDLNDVQGNSLSAKDKKCLHCHPYRGSEHKAVVATTDTLVLHKAKVDADAVNKRRVSLREADSHQEHDKQRMNETRRSVLKQFLPAIFDRLGFQFSTEQRPNHLASVNLKCQMSLTLETKDVFSTRELGMDLVDLGGRGFPSNVQSESPSRMAATSPRPVEFRMPPKSRWRKVGGKIPEGGGQTRVRYSRYGTLRGGNSPVLNPSGIAVSAGKSEARSRTPGECGSSRRVWLRADATGAESAGNLCKDLLTIAGLVSFVFCGTYAFAVSHRYLRLEPWLRKALSAITALSAPATHITSLTQTSAPELTDNNFMDSIQKRPTFVLFYAPWCPYCVLLETTWAELGHVLKKKGYDVQLRKLDAEKNPYIAQKYKVSKYPTLILFNDGKAVDSHLGPRNVDSFVKFIEESLPRPR